MEVPEIDPNFEPQMRARSNTWPLRPKEFTKEDETPRSTPPAIAEVETTPAEQKDNIVTSTTKKTGSRRNAWGNMSYADLITKAIESTVDKRLTLSQIYDWMVQNVPYFKNKGDNSSSAGWKNSIRHNLSLHNRFMRIQNEGAGKSSWWVINPDAKPGKTPRRRATSMDTKSYEKKRTRVKKKVDQMRAALATAEHGLDCQPGSEYGSTSELNPQDTFSLSPQDFRVRTSSNASSIGRLSPIQSGLEPDLHDNQVPPMSPIPWNNPSQMNTGSYTTQDGFTETLSESLVEMFRGEMTLSPGDPGLANDHLRSALSTPSPLQPQLSPNSNFQDQNNSFLPAPPPYVEQMRRSPQQPSAQCLIGNNLAGSMKSSPNMCSNISSTVGSSVIGSLGLSEAISSRAGVNLNNKPRNTIVAGNNGQQRYLPQTLNELLSESGESPMQEQEDACMAYISQSRPQVNNSSTVGMNNQFNPNNCSAFHNLTGIRGLDPGQNNTALRLALSQKPQLHLNQLGNVGLTQEQLQPSLQSALRAARLQRQPLQQQPSVLQMTLQSQLMSGGTMQTNSDPMSNMTTGQPAGLPTDLDVNFGDLNPTDIDCDVDQIIKHELSLDGNLDFNFDASQQVASNGNDGQFGAIQT